MTREDRLARKRAYNKVYYAKNQAELVAKKRVYNKENRERVNTFQRQYVSRNSEKVRQRKLEFYAKNREKILEKAKNYYKETRPQRIEYRARNKVRTRSYENNRYQTVPQYRIAVTLRARVRDAVKREHKSAKTEELLGITFQKFKEYLEGKFKPGMAWENYGTWEIDHIMPLSKFDLTSIAEQRKAFHYTNTQPLWLIENRLKSAKILN